MHAGDKHRKRTLIEHGFRLPSAYDNRPLEFHEFEQVVPQLLFVSATPGPYELERVGGSVVEQVIRPTGLLDPEIEIRPADNQIPDLLERCQECVAKKQRVLVTALTKKLCERLTEFLADQGLRVRYLHSEIETLDRVEILRALRAGDFDILVGVNLLREGLDLPEVSLVCILDADKQGFLRSATSLIQQMGRAARHIDAHVVMYADKVTPAMQQSIEETDRRRDKQIEYNKQHNITPTQIRKAIRQGIAQELSARRTAREAIHATEEEFDITELAQQLEKQMFDSAEALEFEKAADLRDKVKSLRSGKVGKEGKVKQSELDNPQGPSADATAPGAAGSQPRGSKKRKRRQ